MGSEYARFGVASGLATAIFFGSFSGSEKKGLNVQRLRLALLREGIPPALVGDALHRLKDELWYLHVEGGIYSFSSQPNLNRVIVEKEEAVGEELIIEQIRARLEKCAGNDLRVTLWPKASQDVPDTKELKLAILAPEHTKQNSATSAMVEELLKKCGEKFRTYQNTLLVLAPDEGKLLSLRQKVKRYLALRSIWDDKALTRQLSEENRKTLESKWNDVESLIPFELLSAYRHLAKPGENGVEWLDLGIPTVGERSSLSQRVCEYLKNQELLLERISPHILLKKSLREDEHEKPVSEIVEAFLRYPQLPMVRSVAVIDQAISQGVQEGVFGIRVGERVYFGETPLSSFRMDDAVLLRKELIPPPLSGDEPPLEEAPKDTPASGPKPGVAGVPSAPQSLEAGGHRLRLRVKVPWDKLSDFIRGVILPLRNDGADLEVEVFVQAWSESGGIKQETLKHKVKETIRQIDAKILEESHD
jgi:hypothetical protein